MKRQIVLQQESILITWHVAQLPHFVFHINFDFSTNLVEQSSYQNIFMTLILTEKSPRGKMG
jgi:hypothetical protein